MKMIEKLKKHSFSLIVTVIFLALIVLVNIFVSMLTERFFLKLDLTEAGIFTLSDRAAEFLSGVNETVDIVVMAEESTWLANNNLAMISTILTNYSATTGGRIRVQYVNPDLNVFDGPNYGNSLSALVEAHTELTDMTRNDIVFISERRATRVPVASLFVQRTDNFGRPVETSLRVDQEFISALVYVLNESIARIVFVENHGEDSTEHMRQIFERSGYISSSINLALEEIPEDTVLVVSAAPKFDFLSEEIIKLEQFMSLGGNVMIIYDFNTVQLPVLDAFLAEWGVAVENKLIFDEENTFIPQHGVIGAVVSAGALPSTEASAVFTLDIPVGIRTARPLRAVRGEGVMENMFPLVRTVSASSYAKALDGTVTTWEREPGDASGPFTIAYNIRHLTRDAEGTQVWANLIVVGAAMFDDPFLAIFSETFYNVFFLADLANDLNPFGERVFIPARNLATGHLLVSSAGARTVLILMVIALPLLIIAAGILIWRRRRHK
ncbi:MAG: GldG family protein [Oscillospiraceae bacterium]|nr:GldG family protein [Oscillospiraceae bacterium]MCL2277828.1 GldG family protein [Oscillospiraceae bacterium]